MPDKKGIIEYFMEIDKLIDKPVDIIILGGCFLVLNGLKPSSPDIDMIIEGNSYNKIVYITKQLNKKYSYEIDVMTEGYIENIQLPENYIKDVKRYRRYRSNFRFVRLWLLSPYDIIISKINRWKRKDVDDINTILSAFSIKRKKFDKRLTRFKIVSKQIFNKNLSQFYTLFEKKLKSSWLGF